MTYSSKLKDAPHYFLFNKDFRVLSVEAGGNGKPGRGRQSMFQHWKIERHYSRNM